MYDTLNCFSIISICTNSELKLNNEKILNNDFEKYIHLTLTS